MADLTDDQWEYVEPYLPEPSASPRTGRPRTEDRAVLNGILWVLRTGASWRDLPQRYPPRSTCWRRYAEWADSGTLSIVLDALSYHLRESSGVDVSGVRAAGLFPEGYGEQCWPWQTARLFLSPRVQDLMDRPAESALSHHG